MNNNTENEEKREKPDIETRIYKALSTAEKIAIMLAKLNRMRKKSAKKRKKKNKKLCKVDKKTGVLHLKEYKKQKAAPKHKKYKAPKRK